ncbi:MAG TPA: hypothetical protein VF868_08360 [Bacteroidia bacterium]|jgi:hypothetical protein
MSFIKYISALFILGNSSLAFAQISLEPHNTVFSNPVILSHYSVDELNSIHNTDSLKFETIEYYFTKSFIVEAIPCTECRIFNASTFDVSRFEYLRLKSQRFERTFTKYGFKLILLSIDELEYKTPVQQIE